MNDYTREAVDEAIDEYFQDWKRNVNYWELSMNARIKVTTKELLNQKTKFDKLMKIIEEKGRLNIEQSKQCDVAVEIIKRLAAEMERLFQAGNSNNTSNYDAKG